MNRNTSPMIMMAEVRHRPAMWEVMECLVKKQTKIFVCKNIYRRRKRMFTSTAR